METCAPALLTRGGPGAPPPAAARVGLPAFSGETLVLGIESSCDDTGAAVVRGDGRVLGEALASQDAVHEQWGGVVPKLAEEAHAKAIDGVVAEALAQADVSPSQLSAVAVTVGPGLSLCLRVGVRKAHEVARQGGVKLIQVHHMEAHALVARLTERARGSGGDGSGGDGSGGDGSRPGSRQEGGVDVVDDATARAAVSEAASQEGVEFPFVCLLVSGGHSMFLLAHDVGEYTVLGTSLDDAVGEAFDKTARLLGLPVGGGGGPALERLAAKGDAEAVPFRVPMRQKPTCDVSFAGLKTAVRYAADDLLGKEGEWQADESNEQLRADIAASFQRVAVQHLCDRAKRALTWAREREAGVEALVVAGGVAANQSVRAGLEEVCAKHVKTTGHQVRLVCPPLRYCTDNGVMVAWAGVELLARGHGRMLPPATEGDDEWVELRPRWPLGVPHDKATSVKSQKTEWMEHMRGSEAATGASR